jgi:hypothetical protein
MEKRRYFLVSTMGILDLLALVSRTPAQIDDAARSSPGGPAGFSV